MSEELGSGIALDEQFDMSIDSTGDIETVQGADELQKDLSFQLAISLQDVLGETQSSSVETIVRDIVVKVANADSRVQRVDEDRLDVSIEDNGRTVQIDMMVLTESGEEFGLVFEVDS